MSLNGVIIGVDEAGRGPLAGPVVASAVRLVPSYTKLGMLNQLADSKSLSHRKRKELMVDIYKHSQVSIGIAEPGEIDAINILQATMMAMTRALDALSPIDGDIRIDGNQLPKAYADKASAVVGGDRTVAAISAASIIAKTYRDNLMACAARRFTLYNFATHKAYGTKLHKQILEKAGPSPIHRLSFRPIKSLEYLIFENRSQ